MQHFLREKREKEALLAMACRRKFEMYHRRARVPHTKVEDICIHTEHGLNYTLKKLSTLVVAAAFGDSGRHITEIGFIHLTLGSGPSVTIALHL